MSYDFSTLNDKEFERLSRDLLNKKLKMDFQDFKVGRDNGIDLRYSTSKNQNSHIVQVKHYLKSGFAKLYSALEVSELAKVKLLAPDKYYIVTSLPLNQSQKNRICELFTPFIKTTNDIFGQEDLNKYLNEFPEIEKHWFKLWLSSTSVLNTILHNAVLGRSSFFQTSIIKRIKLYVPCISYNDAIEILKKYHYILITGQPGVGKTTLANLITYHLLAQDFQLVYIDGDIKDAETLFSVDPHKRQLFYFDDFLGSNYLEITNPKTSESNLVNFLERIKASNNKYLILTTRTTILKTALSKYEKLNRSKVDLARKEIQLGSYTELEKAQILYNHIFHSDLPEEYLLEVFKEKNYRKIISHRNYFPRLIEFFTTSINVDGIPPQKYFEFIKQSLNVPEGIWKHAYEEQLSVEERMMINSVFCQPSNADLNVTKTIFENFLDIETKHFGFRPTVNPFNNSLKKLLDGILKKETYLYQSNREVLEFVNPSINDFLINYFKINPEAKWILVKGFFYLEQFEKTIGVFFNKDESEELVKVIEYMLDNFEKFNLLRISSFDINISDEKMIKILALISKFTSLKPLTQRIESECLALLKKYPVRILLQDFKAEYISAIEYCDFEGIVYEWVKEHWGEIISIIIEKGVDEEDFEEIKSLFSIFDEDFDEFMLDKYNYDLFFEAVEMYVNEKTSEWIKEEQSSVHNESDWEKMKEKISECRSEFFQQYLMEDDNYNSRSYFDDALYFKLVEGNEESSSFDSYESWAENSIINLKVNSTIDPIDDLFSR